ncbi:hypothetical protein [Candidatus Cyanaurora vandensis]|uniref:hypothetical protein n=1 Tax=Candidatus Cyanaurora vandensis TaxID=2714958 RepID=UPI00257BF077|nr:hypothetical protein [Candidatus Cyanaurora vandensis]
MTRLLVLDRDVVYRPLLMAALVCHRLDPIASQGLAQLEHEINQQQPQLLLLDFGSLENPFQACRQLKQDFPALPLVLLQPGQAVSELTSFAQKQGIQAILPRDPNALLTTVNALLAQIGHKSTRPPLIPSSSKASHTPLSALKDLCSARSLRYQELVREYKEEHKDYAQQRQENERQQGLLYEIARVTGQGQGLKHDPLTILHQQQDELSQRLARLDQQVRCTARLADRYAALVIEIHLSISLFKRTSTPDPTREQDLFTQVQDLERLPVMPQ